MAIIVVIANANALSPPFVSQAGLLRNFGEVSFAIVAVKLRMGAVGSALEGGAVGDEDVVKSIAIIVKDGGPVACRFQDVLLMFAPAKRVRKAQSGGRSDVGKVLKRKWNSQR